MAFGNIWLCSQTSTNRTSLWRSVYETKFIYF